MIELNLDEAIATNTIKLGTCELTAFDDRIIVVLDEFKSGYECTRCEGNNVSNEVSHIPCEDCKSTGRRGEKKCSGCAGEGRVVCPECNGKGGVLIIPQEKENAPTTGIVVSIGEKAVRLKRGDGVLFTSFTGHHFKLTAEDVNGHEVEIWIVMMHEHEVMSKVKGHLALRRVKKSKDMGSVG